MSQDFVEQVTSDSWLSAAKGWIRHPLAEHGMEVRSIEQRRVRPWSTGLVASTDAGPMYFKASCPAMSFEPAVHAALAEIEPHEVDQPPPDDDEDDGDPAGRAATPPEKSVAFTIAVIALGAKLAKADGAVARSEVAAFRRVFIIPRAEEKNAARVFDLARQDVAGYDA